MKRTNKTIRLGDLEATVSDGTIYLRLFDTSGTEMAIKLWTAKAIMDLAQEYPDHEFVLDADDTDAEESEDDGGCLSCADYQREGDFLTDLIDLVITPAPVGDGHKLGWYGRALSSLSGS